ncbi:MAG: trigger factor [Lachnospiraceae bacterium]|nr:trigger factor [Lachnospiraceae bacterium]
MTLQVEKLEKNMAKLTVEVSAEQFAACIQTAYKKTKNRFALPGFRKGKAPLAMIEKMYGAEVFYDAAADEAINETYADAMKESGLEIVSRPEVEVVQIEKGKPFIYTAMVAVKPEVSLGEYKGVEVEKASEEVTDAEVSAELIRVQDQNSRIVTIEDRGVEDGDQTVIDFKGTIDGVPFEGGEAEDYALTIGSHSFIDNFEEQLIGKNIGETCEVHVTFPTEYHAKNLAGKPAVFEVTIKEIKHKELPELNDEFASEVSEFETLDEYKAELKKSLEDRKKKEAVTLNEDKVVEAVVANATMDIPEPMLNAQAESMIQENARRMQSQGISLDQYMQYTGMTMDMLKDQMKPQAERRIKTRLVLEAVVAAEHIEVTEEKIDEEITKMAEAYKMEADKLKEYMGDFEKEQLKKDLAVQAAVDFLVAEAKLV